jgi:uncharacterized membrane protein YvbJ
MKRYCEYCGSQNSFHRDNCKFCGAPFTIKTIIKEDFEYKEIINNVDNSVTNVDYPSIYQTLLPIIILACPILWVINWVKGEL